MITVHHLESSRSLRILWLLEELELEYDLVVYKRDPVTMLAPPELRAVHPLGKSPVVTDGDLTLAESGAILEYLAERYGSGRLLPAPGTPERVRCRYWAHYAEGSLMPLLLLTLIMSRLGKKPVPFVVRPLGKALGAGVMRSFVTPNLTRHLDYINGELAKSAWFAGSQLTIADVQMSFPLEAAHARGGIGERPNIVAFVDKMKQRPAYARAVARGGENTPLG